MKTLKQEEVAGLAYAMPRTHGAVSPASLKTFTIGNDCIQRSITSPRRGTSRPYCGRMQVPYLNSQAVNCPAISLSHCKEFQCCPGFSEIAVPKPEF